MAFISTEEQVATVDAVAGNERIQAAVRVLLCELGENPDREGLVKTPERVAKALRFLAGGQIPQPRAAHALSLGIKLPVIALASAHWVTRKQVESVCTHPGHEFGPYHG